MKFFICIISVLFSFSIFAETKKLKFADNEEFYENFFEDDIELQNINIQSGGVLKLLTGASLITDVGSVTTIGGLFQPGATTFTGNVLVDNASASAAAFRVFDENNDAVLTANTSTDSVSIRYSLTLGATPGPIIDVTSGPLYIFSPSNPNRFAQNMVVRGNISVSGDIASPALFQMQSNLHNLQSMVQTKEQFLKTLETKMNQVDKEITTIKEITEPRGEVLSFIKMVSDNKKQGKDLASLFSGKDSKADEFHMHEVLPQDVTFEKNIFVKGNMINVNPWKKSKHPLLSFAQESPRPLLSDSGVAYLVNGEATIDLDPQYLAQVTIDENTPLNIQLTPEGECNGLYISSKTSSGFTVRELARGRSNLLFHWRVEGAKKGVQGKYFTLDEYKQKNQ